MPRGFLVKRMRRESPISYRIRPPQEDHVLLAPLPTDAAPRKGPKAGGPLGPQDWAQNPPRLVSAALLPGCLGRGPGSGSPVPGASAPSCAPLSPGSGSACATAARRAGGAPVEPAPEAGGPPGALVCQLCQEAFPGPLALAQHCCARIARVEYRCQECGKAFSCPANLASHRRWHKPRAGGHAGGTKENERPPPAGAGPTPPRPGAPEGSYRCSHCPRRFRRRAYLGKHLALHTATGPVLSESQQLHRNRGPQSGSWPKKPF